MSATRRRTQFAAPVIAIAACSSSKEPPRSQQFPGVTWNVRMQMDMKCIATEPGPNPPPPRSIACPPGMSGTTVFVIGEVAKERCGIVPRGCFDATCVTIPAECPLPPGQEAVQKLAVVWTIEKRGADCHAEEGEGHDACPSGVDCNPPMPRIVTCPPGVTDTQTLRIAELVDARCVVVPDGCEDTGCAKQVITCPVAIQGDR